MRIAIVGAGAMGSLLGHGLQRGGHEVALLDLPARVEQIRTLGGLAVIGEDGVETSTRPSLVTTDYAQAGPHDLVILATKAHDLPAVAAHVPQLMGPDSVVLTIQNGIPWWYLQGLQGNFEGARIPCLDPDGALERHIPTGRIVGCVAYPAASLDADGRVRHVEGRRFPVGELDGVARARTRQVAAALEEAGFKSRVIDDVRSEIWLKAWGALSINPISALTGATMAGICSFAPTRDLVASMMQEAKGVAEALGATFRHTIDERIEGARRVGAHKTSMLQDVEAGRPLELDALMLAVLELAELTGVSAPTIRSVYACAALLNEGVLASRRGRGSGP